MHGDASSYQLQRCDALIGMVKSAVPQTVSICWETRLISTSRSQLMPFDSRSLRLSVGLVGSEPEGISSISTIADTMRGGTMPTAEPRVGLVPLEPVLCQFVGKLRWTPEPYYGAIVIEVARAADIEHEFNLVMTQRNASPYVAFRMTSWKLTSYLPRCGRSFF